MYHTDRRHARGGRARAALPAAFTSKSTSFRCRFDRLGDPQAGDRRLDFGLRNPDPLGRVRFTASVPRMSHVHQVEEPGGLGAFLARYLKQIADFTTTRPTNDPSGTRNYARVPNRAADLARARAASTSRSRGSVAVTRASTRTRAVAATSSTARSKAALLALDGVLNPLSFLTNWSDAARISSSDAGGWKLNNVLMFLHISWSPPVGLRH